MARRIIEAWHYHHGLSQREIASRFGLSPVAVSNYLEYGHSDEPATELPGVGPPNDRLFLQGKCLGCEIPLFGPVEVPRDYCGECDPRAKLI